jgi:GDP-4-dehydro-6-deoxy-D-mannose reductase
MRVLITGIAGFVGRHLAAHLAEATDWQLCGLVRSAARHGSVGTVPLIEADLTDAAATGRAIAAARPQLIFHLAAQANVPQSFADPVGTFQANVIAQLNLLRACIAAGDDPLLVIASSSEIYGPVASHELPVTEATPLRPVNPYAVAKATQDLMAYQYFASHRLRSIRLRLFNHIGPGQSEAFVSAAFAAQIARIEAGLQPPLMRVGNLAAERDFSDVRDIACAYEAAARHGVAGEAYNIASDRPVAIAQLLTGMLARASVAIRIEHDQARMRPSDVPRVVGDSRRFRDATGWQPQRPLDQTLDDILADWRIRIRSPR